MPVITLEGHGRESIDPTIDVSRSVGWFTTAFPVCLPIQSNLSDSIKSIKETLRAIPNKGIAFGSIMKEEKLPGIVFNYLGQFDAANGYWQVASESSGRSVASENEGQSLLTINGAVIDGQLQFTITTRLSDGQAAAFIQHFQSELESLITHCQNCNKQMRNFLLDSHYQPIVEFSTGRESPSVFFVHPSFLGCETYIPLVRLLPSGHPYYGINSYNLYSNKSMMESIEGLAEHYLKEMADYQTGPIILVGWSLGGLITLEMAKQLSSKNINIERVIMIDSSCPSAIPSQIKSFDSFDNIIASLPNHLKDAFLNMPESQRERFLKSRVMDNQLVRNYRAPVIHIPVTLLKATGSDVNNYQPDNGWGDKISNLKIELIDADHFSIMSDEHITQIAKHIQEDIKRKSMKKNS